MDPAISVRGIGTTEAEPERAGAAVEVEARGADRGEAVRSLEARRVVPNFG